MKLITKAQQRECVLRLVAIRKITDDMNNTLLENSKKDVKRWADNMEYLADNLLEIAYILGGVEAMKTIAPDVEITIR